MNTAQQTNNSAIIGLILGILSIILPFIGFIVGIVGIVFSAKSLKIIKESQENGRGLAIGGLICSISGVVFQLLAILGVLAFTMLMTSSTL